MIAVIGEILFSAFILSVIVAANRTVEARRARRNLKKK
jgi:hypothetical protein